MSTTLNQPLQNLAPAGTATPYTGQWSSHWGAYLLGFIILVVIIWFILYALRPTYVLKTCLPGQPQLGEVDPGKVLFASIIIALIIVLIIWIIRIAAKQFIL